MANSQNRRNKIIMCEWCEYYQAASGSSLCARCSRLRPLDEFVDKKK